MEKQCKENNRKILLLNIIFVIVDAVIITLLIGCLVCFFVASTKIILLSCELQNVSGWEYDDLVEQITVWIQVLGVSLTGVLIPIVITSINVMNSEKRLKGKVFEALAQGANIRFYVILFPFGVWSDLASKYYEEIQDRCLTDYKYGLHLVFTGSIFQRVVFKSIRVKIGEGSEQDADFVWQKDETENSKNKCVISDSTGVEKDPKQGINGTNITLLFDQNNKIEENLLALKSGVAKVEFNFQFEPSQDRFGIRWEQFKKCLFGFPLIRGLYEILVKCKMKYSYCKYTLHMNSYVYTDNRMAQLNYNIYDIDLKEKRGLIKMQ